MTLSVFFGLCFLGSCGTDDPPPAPGSEGPVSDDPAVLAAFEVCYKEMSAEVLADNQPMIKVFEKAGLPMESRLESGVYQVSITIKK